MALQLHYLVFTPKIQCSEKKDHLYPSVHSSNGHSRQTVERTKMPFNGQMDKEDVVRIHYGVLCLHQKGWISNFCSNMDGTGGDYAEWNKSSRESQWSYGFTYLWSITNNTEDMGRWRGEGSWGKLEGEVNHERLWTLKNNLRVLKGRGLGAWRNQVVGIREGMDCMEHWVWCKNNEFCYAEKKYKI